MTPSTILLTFCLSIFFALFCTFVAYFVLHASKKGADSPLRVLKEEKEEKRKSIPISQEGIPEATNTHYPLAKAK